MVGVVSSRLINTLAFLVGVLLIVAIAMMQGCATTAGNEEIAWQVANVIDTGQTETIAREPDRWREMDPVTRNLIGSHPSEKSVYLCMAGYAVLHVGVSALLEHEVETHGESSLWPKILNAWEFTTLSAKGFEIGNNERQGISPWR